MSWSPHLHRPPLAGPPEHPVLRLLWNRSQGQEDGEVLALAVEGGGVAGTVSAGMCVVIEQLGLTQYFDLIVGVSAGALNGSYLACGQATLGATNYLDSAGRHFISHRNLLHGKPAINMPVLFTDIMNRKPYRLEALQSGRPRFACLAASLDRPPEQALVRLTQFPDQAALRRAVQASCQMPGVAGPPVVIDEEALIDGALVESMPYPSARALGATQVIVLRSYPARHRKSDYGALSLAYIRRAEPRAEPLVEMRAERYNQQVDELLEPSDKLVQIAPEREGCETFERDARRIRRSIALGAQAAAEALGAGPLRLRWQPLLDG